MEVSPQDKETKLAFAEYVETVYGAIKGEVEQCNHVVGLTLASYPADGETDRLARVSEGVVPDEAFPYCPLCGESLLDQHAEG
jgi:hypothetical protein